MEKEPRVRLIAIGCLRRPDSSMPRWCELIGKGQSRVGRWLATLELQVVVPSRGDSQSSRC